MFNIALYAPRIPPNTGAAARLCAASGARLHLIRPLGFRIDDAAMRRAGLDYWDAVDVTVHANLDEFLAVLGNDLLFLITKFGESRYTEVSYPAGAWFLFGSETDGLPADLIERHRDNSIVIPMREDAVRSLNLASAVAIVLYEALRQNNFEL